MDATRLLPPGPCALHGPHAPHVASRDEHHVVPASWWAAAGRPSASRRVAVCPTGHRNVHAALDLLVAHQGAAPWAAWRHFGPAERALATEGYESAVAAGLTPAPTL